MRSAHKNRDGELYIHRMNCEFAGWRVVNLASVRGRQHMAPVGAFRREAMKHKWLGKMAIAVERAAAPSE